jgi:hypothetical protein
MLHLKFFSRVLGINLIHLNSVDSLRFGLDLTITVLPKLNTLKQADKPARFTRIRHNLSKYMQSTGILTCFPFDLYD